ncbi:sporulation integral membrane protein YlbJ [Lutispora sp.]|uniref:sporulation integral membrane protein YlbJ n=1 Tax=Lutispora sp. TaxID=2828727 RepID=UPI002B201800|nr:sporulation integral membrane protein YlbJ [Lutispora sp.]MEA4960126.1 sporulation integral membrane protein YlbJ [Lutispora sp.]
MIKKYLSTFINALIFLFIIFSIMIFPEESFKASLEGLNLWLNVVCPALLPFFICVEILIGLGVVSFIGSIFKPLMSVAFNVPGEGAFAFVMSIASGYPVGAKIIASLRMSDQCSKTEAQRMISLCSTSGPLFIIGAVSVGILKKPQAAAILLIAHYLSAISCGFIMRFYKRNEMSKKDLYITNPFKELINYRKTDKRSIGQLMGDSVKNGVSLILLVGGYIIIFSVISKIIKVTGILTLISGLIDLIPLISIDSNHYIPVVISGLLELTNGIKECAQAYMPDLVKAIMISFFIGFGGLSVNAQVSGIIQDTDINFFIYFLMKILQGVLAAIYTLFLNKLGNLPVFNTYSLYSCYRSLNWYNIIILSIKAVSLLSLFMALLSFTIYMIGFSSRLKNKLN